VGSVHVTASRSPAAPRTGKMLRAGFGHTYDALRSGNRSHHALRLPMQCLWPSETDATLGYGPERRSYVSQRLN